MKNKITLRMWLSVFFGGIWQFIRNIFSWKNKTTFWRVIWATITACFFVITCALMYDFYKACKRDHPRVSNVPISTQMDFSRYEYEKGAGWISNRTTGEIVTPNVDWVQVSKDGDSLAVFSSAGKRGYLNRFSGRVAIAPQFDKAWIFSSGVAAVAKDNKVFFIDHSGRPVNDKTFVLQPRGIYVFHGDYCVMNDENDLLGLIDRDGNWKVEPKYLWIHPATHNYWKMRLGDNDSGLLYAFNDKAEPVNDVGVGQLDITDDLGVIYTLPNHLKMVVDFDGNRSEQFLCRDIEAMYYDTDERDSTDSFVPARCTLYRYRMDDGYEGLCRENGEIVTEPIYWSVQPVGKDLYHCTYKDADVGVIIDSKGKITQS